MEKKTPPRSRVCTDYEDGRIFTGIVLGAAGEVEVAGVGDGRGGGRSAAARRAEAAAAARAGDCGSEEREVAARWLGPRGPAPGSLGRGGGEVAGATWQEAAARGGVSTPGGQCPAARGGKLGFRR